MDNIVIWKFVAGIGFFLLGLQLMDQSLTRLAGRRFKKFLQRYTNTLPKALFSGTILTSLLQSSSVLALITLGFVEAGLIPFRNALGVIMGSNVGSTMISWIVATVGFKMNIEELALPGLALSSLGMFFSSSRKYLFQSFRFLFAVSLLFYGIGFMKDAAGNYVKEIDITSYADQPLVIFVLIGFLITSVVQTSSATMAIALAALYAQAIPLTAAAAVVIGSETGSALKTFIAGLNGSSEKRRAAFGNFYFNVFTTIGALVFLYPLLSWIRQGFGVVDPMLSLAFFQTLINVLSIVAFLPFIGLFSRFLERTIQSGKENVSFVQQPELLLGEADATFFKEEVRHLLGKCLEFHDMVFDVHLPEQNGLGDTLRSLTRVHGQTEKMYIALKTTEGELLDYYVKCRNQSPEMAEQMADSIESQRQVIHAAKSVKDIHHNITNLREAADDTLHGHFHRLRENWTFFNQAFQKALHHPESLDELMHLAHEALLSNNRMLEEQLSAGLMTEMDTSTLLNIERELLSSKKALVRAARYLSETSH